jgi:hypothetical protein
MSRYRESLSALGAGGDMGTYFMVFFTNRRHFHARRIIARAALLLATLALFTTRLTAETPLPGEEHTTLILRGDILRVPLSEIAPNLDPSKTVRVDILNKYGESYIERASKLFQIMTTTCHVGVISTSQRIFQTCSTSAAIQIKAWRDFIADLKKAIAKKNHAHRSAAPYRKMANSPNPLRRYHLSRYGWHEPYSSDD